jgi:hypothetical protein
MAAALLSLGLFLGAGSAAATTTKPSPWSEPPLIEAGGILDQLYGLGNLVPIVDSDQIWGPGNGNVTAKAKFADFSQAFGYIPQSTGGTFYSADFVPILNIAGGTNAIGFGKPSATLDSGDVKFLWALDPSGSPLWTSLPDLNSDSLDHMLTWLVSGNEGNPKNPVGSYVIAWEDFAGGGDLDFNDLVVEVNLSPVPIPPAFLLLGSGLVGLVGLRKRFKG